jgi:hypothetical protein
MTEIHVKSNNTLRGVVVWTYPYPYLYPWPTPKHVTKLATGQYHPKENNTTAQQIALAQLVVSKYKKIELVENSSTYNTGKQETR